MSAAGRSRARALAGHALLCASLFSSLSRANPHALPFTYPTDSLPKGALEVEQYVDMSPTPATDPVTAASITALNYTLTTEIEYGITNKLELGLYFQLSNDLGLQTTALSFDGVKQRLRYRLASPGQWPVDVAFYLEVAELKNEIEIEAKVNLQRRAGPFTFLVNLWLEREFYYDGSGEWALHPTGGVTVQLHPSFHLGLEFWMHGEFGRTTPGNAPLASATLPFDAAFHEYLGPAALVSFGRFWWSTGVYLRLDGITAADPQYATYSHVWIRTVIGIDL